MIDITPNLIAPLVLEQSNYLPYGTRIQDQYFTSAVADNRWRYAGKEEQDFTPFSTLNLSLLDFGARMYDPFIARWTAVDPVANLSHSFGPFSYCAGNPIISRDRDGNFPETVWDVASLVMGVKSFVSNVKEGNVGGAILDGVGIIADAAAVLAPGIPGGAGAGIKAVRAGDKVADIVKGADKITDATKAIDNGKALSKAGNVAKTTTHSDDLKNVIYEVPGSATMDGKPYIGRTNDLSRRRHENRDGRDRTKAIVIGHYDPDVPKSGAIQEQKAINERGLDNLSNKRNEIKQSDWDRYGIR